MGYNISLAAKVPLGDVLVINVTEEEIGGYPCLTALLWITGVNGTIANSVGHCRLCVK